jgi:hypothetical protein
VTILVKIVALMASLLAFLIVLAVGAAAFGIPESGERTSGLVLAIGALIAFGAALLLVFAPIGYFRGSRRALAIVAALAAIVPVAALGWATLKFAGAPSGRGSPVLDWGGFTLGAVFIAGAAALLLLGYWRATERARRTAEKIDEATASIAPSRPPPAYGREDVTRARRI